MAFNFPAPISEKINTELFGKTQTAMDFRVIAIKSLSQDGSDVHGPWGAGTHACVTFPAFIRGDINESFSPNWSDETIFGRVDNIARYSGTQRSISFSFMLLALKDNPNREFAVAAQAAEDSRKGLVDTIGGKLAHAGITLSSIGREGIGGAIRGAGMTAGSRIASGIVGGDETNLTKNWLEVNFDSLEDVEKKLKFLQTLVYPKFSGGRYKKPPMVQMMITDQFFGVQGYISDLSITHQIENAIGISSRLNYMSPMSYEISLTLNILHSESPHSESLVF
jgi:hypothetical protein